MLDINQVLPRTTPRRVAKCLRDVLVLQSFRVVGYEDRDALIAEFNKAFGGPVHEQLLSQLLSACARMFINVGTQCPFQSKNKKKGSRRRRQER